MNTQALDENEVYHADTRRIGKSGLDLIAKSPAHYWAKYLDPNRVREEPSKALRIGSAVHAAVLEPEVFRQKYIIAPSFNMRTNDGKEKHAQLMEHCKANKLTLIDTEEHALCMKMREAVMKVPAAAVLLEAGVAEQRIDWEREIVTEDGELIGVQLKAKPDWLSHNDFIVDLKTTEDASPQGFAKSVWNFRYHVQAPFYCDAYEHKFGKPPRGFIFIAVEKNPPYAVALYYATPEIMDRGRSTYERDLRTYQKCLETGEWPAYGTEIKPLQLPGWAK